MEPVQASHYKENCEQSKAEHDSLVARVVDKIEHNATDIEEVQVCNLETKIRTIKKVIEQNANQHFLHHLDSLTEVSSWVIFVWNTRIEGDNIQREGQSEKDLQYLDQPEVRWLVV